MKLPCGSVGGQSVPPSITLRTLLCRYLVKRYTHFEAQVVSACFNGLELTRSQPRLAETGSAAISAPMALRLMGWAESLGCPAKTAVKTRGHTKHSAPVQPPASLAAFGAGAMHCSLVQVC
jgi:hypothetical protein